jgi:hypothetical protein
MSFWFFVVLIPVIAIPLVVKWNDMHEVTWQEFGINFGAGIALVSVMYMLSAWNATSDVEYLNGTITGKDWVRVSCNHSYSCNCRPVTTGSGNNQTTTVQCDTCYEHSYDFDWMVYTSVGNFAIDRVDRRGTHEPDRWSIVQNGQPVALPHTYTNYVKASPDSIFHLKPMGDPKTVPEYPKPYDYHYTDRVIPVGVNIPNIAYWNEAFAKMNSRIGPTKQGNVVMIVTNNSSRNYGDLVQKTWIGGKKNDIVIVIGAPKYPEVQWVKVFSWSRHDIINVNLRNSLATSILDVETTVPMIEASVMKYYERKPMKDFEYLASNVEPSGWLIALMLIVGSLVSGFIAYHFRNN